MSVVHFDFEGALRLARSLDETARWLEGALVERSGAAEAALRQWSGPHGDDFRVRSEVEDQEARSVVGALRGEARDWARAWSDAMNEQNRRNRAAAIEAADADRGAFEQVWDGLFGGESVADLVSIPPPRSPEFRPTGSLQDF